MPSSSYMLMLLAMAYTAFASTTNTFSELVSREYTNPDPGNDPLNFFGYVPNNTYAIISIVAFAITAISQTYLVIRHRGYFMLAMLIAEFTFIIGLGMRLPLHDDPTQKGLYIVENTLVVLSPVGFIAANYVLLGRLAKWLKCNSYMLIRPERVTLIFVLSDAFTFLIQGSGGGISATGDPDKAKLGSRIFLVGLILQGVSFVFFTFMYTFFLYRVYTRDSQIWNRDAGKGWMRDWRSLGAALYVSCIFILIRSGYRIAELSQGYHGSIAKKEGLFYLLDVLCLFGALIVYTPFWPGRFINAEVKEVEMSENVGRAV